ncbi:MAG: TM2 domain-containing protein [Pelomonas sp.]|nr:TM2 domain-containing protein [Roseateles sp.]
MTMPRYYKSKTAATWIALVGGMFGLHRFYLHGWRDRLGWLHWPPTLVGLWGFARAWQLGQDDRLAWALTPLGGVMLTLACAMAIYYGLVADARWDARYNPGGTIHATRWAPIVGVIVALLIGGIALMSTLAYGTEHGYLAMQPDADGA